MRGEIFESNSPENAFALLRLKHFLPTYSNSSGVFPLEKILERNRREKSGGPWFCANLDMLYILLKMKMQSNQNFEEKYPLLLLCWWEELHILLAERHSQQSSSCHHFGHNCDQLNFLLFSFPRFIFRFLPTLSSSAPYSAFRFSLSEKLLRIPDNQWSPKCSATFEVD